MDKQEPIQGAIKVKLLFFGPLAEKLNQRTIDLSLSYGTTINQIIERFELSSMVSRGLVVALDGEIGVDLNSKVSDSSEIAFTSCFWRLKGFFAEAFEGCHHFRINMGILGTQELLFYNHLRIMFGAKRLPELARMLVERRANFKEVFRGYVIGRRNRYR